MANPTSLPPRQMLNSKAATIFFTLSSLMLARNFVPMLPVAARPFSFNDDTSTDRSSQLRQTWLAQLKKGGFAEVMLSVDLEGKVKLVAISTDGEAGSIAKEMEKDAIRFIAEAEQAF